MQRFIGIGETRRTVRGANTLVVQKDKQSFGFGTAEETVGGVRQLLTGYRPRAEDFVFPERFDGGGGDGSDGDGVTDSIEDLD